MATSVATLIFNAETNKLLEAASRLDNVESSAKRADKATTNFGKNMRLTKGPTSALSSTSGQLAVQFQDVAVQAQMGTDAVRIFGQQAPQILSVFGPTGAVIGAVAAIGAAVGSSLVSAFGNAGDAAEEFLDAVKVVKKSVDDLSDGTYGLSTALLDLAEKSEAAARLQIAIALDNAEVAASRARKEFRALGIEGEGMYRSIEGVNGGIQRLLLNFDNIVRQKLGPESSFKQLRDGANAAGISVDSARNLFEDYLKAIDPNSGGTALVAFAENLAEVAIAVDDPRFRELANTFLEQAMQAQTTEEKALLLKQAMDDLATVTGQADQKTIDFVERLKQMAREATMTREQILALQVAQISDPKKRAEAEEALKIIQFEAEAREEAARAQKAADDARRAADAQARADAKAKADAEREAYRKAKQDQAEYLLGLQLQREAEAKAAREAAERTREQQRLEREKQNAERELVRAGLVEEENIFEQRKKMLDQFLQDGLITKQRYAQLEAKIEEQKKEFAITTAVAGLQALGKYNKTAFEAYKAYASGKAIMDTYAAATKALAELPFPFNYVAAAGTVAMGLANVATIQSQQYQGRALGGQVRGGQTYVVGERGPELLTMGANGSITPNEKLSSSGGAQSVSETVNINFQISANDASGFDELLVQRRAMIVNMISQAMNNRGKRALI